MEIIILLFVPSHINGSVPAPLVIKALLAPPVGRLAAVILLGKVNVVDTIALSVVTVLKADITFCNQIQ